MPDSPLFRDAYAACLRIARGHYENFPVASILLPRRLRGPVAAIYAFARAADDFADEGDAPAEARLRQLARWGEWLDGAVAGAPPDHPVFIALSEAIPRFDLPPRPFHDLLDAFRQDVTTRRYPTFEALLDYCRRSADPVGRLLLHLNGEASEENLAHSDAVCSALQLINFHQDVQQDYHEQGRIYLPQEEMARYGVSEADIAAERVTPEMGELMAFQIRRARELMLRGAPLGRALRGRFGVEIRLIVEGGLRVCRRLEEAPPFARPRLRRGDYLGMLGRALFPAA
ncbi:squalene synthase HpnC [Endothiovibrio diazotrophicus]